jgi:hypothetical protein
MLNAALTGTRLRLAGVQGGAAIACLWLCRLSSYIAGAMPLAMVPSLYPTDIRNFALGVLVATSRVGGLLSPLVLIHASLHYWAGTPYAVSFSLAVAAGVMVLLLLPKDQSSERLTERQQLSERMQGLRQPSRVAANLQQLQPHLSANVHGDVERDEPSPAQRKLVTCQTMSAHTSGAFLV